MKKKIIQTRAVAILRVSSGNDSVLIMHGGLCKVKTLAKAKIFGHYAIDASERAQRNVNRLNAIFWDAALDDSGLAGDLIREHSSILPTWCRPLKIDNGRLLQEFFGTSKVIKAHDVQPHLNCNVKGQSTHADESWEPMQDGELCRIDIAMSRAFGKYGGGRIYGYCELRCGTDGAIERKLFQWSANQVRQEYTCLMCDKTESFFGDEDASSGQWESLEHFDGHVSWYCGECMERMNNINDNDY